MSKTLSFIFASSSLVLLILAGAALSYRKAWLAGLFVLLYVVAVGFGFVLKAKLRKNHVSTKTSEEE